MNQLIHLAAGGEAIAHFEDAAELLEVPGVVKAVRFFDEDEERIFCLT